MSYKIERGVQSYGYVSKYFSFDDSVSILSPIVVKRFALDTLLEVKVAKDKSLDSPAKTQRLV